MQSTMKRVFLCLALAPLLATSLAAQDWIGRGRVQGRIVDQEGDPVEGAKVKLHLPDRPDSGPEPVSTDEKGRWAIGGLEGATWVVMIEKEGYVTSEGRVKISEFTTTPPLEIELRRNPFAGIEEGQELIDKGRYPEAREKLRQALPEMDEHQQAQLRTLIGTTYYQEERYEEAAQAYEKALPGLSPEEQTNARLRLGDAYLQLGQHQRARATYEAALEGLDPAGRNQVLMAIAQSYDLEGKRGKAIETVQRILEQNPDDAPALQLIADLLGREGREEEAQEYLDRIPEDQVLPADILLNQGIRFFNEQKLDKALVNFDRVIQQDPEAADAYYYRGLVYLNRGNNEQARSDFQTHLELVPDSQYAAEVEEFLDYLEGQ